MTACPIFRIIHVFVLQSIIVDNWVVRLLLTWPLPGQHFESTEMYLMLKCYSSYCYYYPSHINQSHTPPLLNYPPPPPFGFCCVCKKFYVLQKACHVLYSVRYIIYYGIYYARASDVSPDAHHLSRHLG